MNTLKLVEKEINFYGFDQTGDAEKFGLDDWSRFSSVIENNKTIKKWLDHLTKGLLKDIPIFVCNVPEGMNELQKVISVEKINLDDNILGKQELIGMGSNQKCIIWVRMDKIRETQTFCKKEAAMAILIHEITHHIESVLGENQVMTDKVDIKQLILLENLPVLSYLKEINAKDMKSLLPFEQYQKNLMEDQKQVGEVDILTSAVELLTMLILLSTNPTDELNPLYCQFNCNMNIAFERINKFVTKR